mmetsp:Transcript_6418/g.19416  ORF Transcript_6418/g.19416 Transcript_6418/m.19416 type:complete len:453 (+) Transcript_6418:368-1726(+)
MQEPHFYERDGWNEVEWYISTSEPPCSPVLRYNNRAGAVTVKDGFLEYLQRRATPIRPYAFKPREHRLLQVCCAMSPAALMQLVFVLCETNKVACIEIIHPHHGFKLSRLYVDLDTGIDHRRGRSRTKVPFARLQIYDDGSQDLSEIALKQSEYTASRWFRTMMLAEKWRREEVVDMFNMLPRSGFRYASNFVVSPNIPGKSQPVVVPAHRPLSELELLADDLLEAIAKYLSMSELLRLSVSSRHMRQKLMPLILRKLPTSLLVCEYPDNRFVGPRKGNKRVELFKKYLARAHHFCRIVRLFEAGLIDPRTAVTFGADSILVEGETHDMLVVVNYWCWTTFPLRFPRIKRALFRPIHDLRDNIEDTAGTFQHLSSFHLDFQSIYSIVKPVQIANCVKFFERLRDSAPNLKSVRISAEQSETLRPEGDTRLSRISLQKVLETVFAHHNVTLHF